jgi:hypothetical protein
VYVKLPEEDHEVGKCGRLIKAMYGTRDAAQNWECEYVEFMESVGFRRGQSTPCVFWHKERGIRAVIHGDDFTLLGNDAALNWFGESIQEKFEVNFRGRPGPGVNDGKSFRILNRIITWKEDGIHYEVDQRHAEIIIRQLGLRDNSNALSTPGIKASDGGERRLGERETTLYRAMVARANYLSQDRTDIQFATKEICRKTAEPTIGDWEAMKRLGRYLMGKTRVVNKFDFITPEKSAKERNRLFKYISEDNLPVRFGGKYESWPVAFLPPVVN